MYILYAFNRCFFLNFLFHIYNFFKNVHEKKQTIKNHKFYSLSDKVVKSIVSDDSLSLLVYIFLVQPN